MSDAMGIERGCLVLADIGGYTKYLSGVELDHSQDILADLLGVVITSLTSRLALAKLEGDAVFCYDRDSEDADGLSLLTLMEGCYFAFHERQRDIKHATTCDCDACRLIPQLTVKFVAHHGAYIVHDCSATGNWSDPTWLRGGHSQPGADPRRVQPGADPAGADRLSSPMRRSDQVGVTSSGGARPADRASC